MYRMKHIISAILHWSLCINIPLISSQQILNPSAINCLGAPCMYKDDCRDSSGLCGDGIDHCNEMSQWIPLCGGSANLEKPSLFEPSPSSTTSYQTTPKMPVMMPTIMASPQGEPSTMSPGTSTQTTTTVEQPPSSSAIIESAEGTTTSAPPSTAWNSWVGGGNKNDGNEENGPTKSSTNETDWFNNVADSWGERFNSTEGDEDEEDESFFDKIDFWNNNASQEDPSSPLKGMLIFSSIMMIMIGYLV